MFTPYFEIKYDLLSSIYFLILKAFNIINQSKNIDLKNPIKLIFTTITEKVFSSNNLDIVIPIMTLFFSWYNLSCKNKIENSGQIYFEEEDADESIDSSYYKKFEISNDEYDKLKEEINNNVLNKSKNVIYLECLSLELLSQGLLTIHNKNKEENEEEEEIEVMDQNEEKDEKVEKIKEENVENVENDEKKEKTENNQ